MVSVYETKLRETLEQMPKEHLVLLCSMVLDVQTHLMMSEAIPESEFERALGLALGTMHVAEHPDCFDSFVRVINQLDEVIEKEGA